MANTVEKRTFIFGFLGAAAFMTLYHSGPAIAQVQGSLTSFLKLQATTPGTPQTGHSNITGTAIAGQFQGVGTGLTGLNASNLASGTVADARLSSNVDLLNGIGQIFSTPKTFSASPSFTNATTPFVVTSTNRVGNLNADLLDNQTGAFYQDATNLTAGLLPDARLSANVDLLNGNQTYTGQKTFSQFPSFSNATVPFIVSSTTMVGNLNAQYLAGQGAGYYKDATNLTTGILNDARLSTNVALLNSLQTFTAQKTFTGGVKFPQGAASGRLLTSDATGNASWANPPDSPTGATLLLNTDVPPTGYESLHTLFFPTTVYEPYGSLPSNIHVTGIAGYNNKVYIMGFVVLNQTTATRFYVYDMNTNTTTQLSSLGQFTGGGEKMVADSGYVFRLAATTGAYYVKRYEIATDTWTTSPFSPIDPGLYTGVQLGVANGDPLLFGGSKYGEYVGNTWRLVGGVWQQKGSMNAPRAHCGVASYFGEPVAFGGGTNVVENYVPSIDAWFAFAFPWLPEDFGSDPQVASIGPAVDDYVIMSTTTGYHLVGGPNGTWNRIQPAAKPTSGAYGSGGKMYLSDGTRFTPSTGLYWHRKL